MADFAMTTLTEADQDRNALLSKDDPPPFTVLNRSGSAPVIFIADHAGRAIPRILGNLGLDPSVLMRHIAWDIGIADVTRHLSALMDAPAVLGGYSRLVIDCNRRLDDPTSIPAVSDGVVIPGNKDISDAARAARVAACFDPYHRAVGDLVAERRKAGSLPAVISMHSFTPVMNGFQRPWHIGVLWDRDPRLPVPFMARLRQEAGLCVGDNQPYTGRDQHGYSIDAHAAEFGLPHVLIEIRQDLIDTEAEAEAWAERLAFHLEAILADPSIFTEHCV